MSKLTGRLLLQKCDKVTLKNHQNSVTDGDVVNMVSINKGLVAYVAFLKGASMATVESMTKTICNASLFHDDNENEKVDLGNLPGDLLLVPHFCLGGKLRGKTFQYHSIADKESAEKLFMGLYDSCKTKLMDIEKWKLNHCKVEHGIYGLRQDINAEMNGPMSHIVDYND